MLQSKLYGRNMAQPKRVKKEITWGGPEGAASNVVAEVVELNPNPALL
jgi:hypothetical protein